MHHPSRSKPIAGTIGTIFGGLWAFIASMAAPPGWRVPLAILALCATVLLVVRIWRLRPEYAAAGEKLFGRKAYQIAVVAEVLAIYAASALLPRLGWQDYFIEVIGIIVGLHFIGLWKATGSSRFLAIAAAMCAVSAIAIALPASLHFFQLRDFFTGSGNALVLWLGASRSNAEKPSSTTARPGDIGQKAKS